MADRRHLSVVRTAQDEHAAKVEALRQIGGRVPSRMQRTYDWSSTFALDLFEAMNTCVVNGMRVSEIEDVLDMPGVGSAYMDWLGRQ